MKQCKHISLVIFAFLLAFSISNIAFAKKVEAATVITVKTVNVATVKKVNASLVKGRATTLKVKGSKSAATKKITSIQKQIKKYNKQGVIFQYSKGKKQGGYYLFKVSKENAQLYMYSVKFIKKLYGNYLNSLRKNEDVKKALADEKLYSDARTRKLRILYDYLLVRAATLNASFQYINNKIVPAYDDEMIGYDLPVTQSNIYIEDYYDKSEYYNAFIIKKRTLESKEVDGVYGNYTMSYYRYQMYSFEEFQKLAHVNDLISKAKIFEITSQQHLALSNDFCDLSDAMKVYVIAASNYFCGNMKREGFQMVYKYVYYGYGGSKGMKTLYQNKAKGVCQVFACYEDLVFRQLGIKSYIVSSYKINHAWTVVKVKNSAGKTLWIPFDYGIGPSEYLMVSKSQKKYINTEKKRYKLYLSAIKGAPSKKNFTEKDFN